MLIFQYVYVSKCVYIYIFFFNVYFCFCAPTTGVYFCSWTKKELLEKSSCLGCTEIYYNEDLLYFLFFLFFKEFFIGLLFLCIYKLLCTLTFGGLGIIHCLCFIKTKCECFFFIVHLLFRCAACPLVKEDIIRRLKTGKHNWD